MIAVRDAETQETLELVRHDKVESALEFEAVKKACHSYVRVRSVETESIRDEKIGQVVKRIFEEQLPKNVSFVATTNTVARRNSSKRGAV